jgi:selenocysteine-specific translation elongation factor
MTQSFSVALLGSKSIGGELGKKGTSSDITLYNATGDGRAITFVEPTQFPEKLPPLMNALYMGDRVILAVEALSRDLGETIVTTDIAGKTEGLVALSETVGKDEIVKALKGTTLERYPILSMDTKEMRSKIAEWPAPASSEGSAVVPIDHAFPVRGVGTVVLGFVRSGTIHIHEKMRLYPDEKSVEVKSMQVHDVDVNEASVGSRVGLALKGVEVEEVSRGQIIAAPEALRVSDLLELHDFNTCRFFKGKAGEGDKVHVSIGLKVVPANVDRVDGTNRTLRLASPVAWTQGEKAFVVQLSGAGGGPRVAGCGTIT